MNSVLSGLGIDRIRPAVDFDDRVIDQRQLSRLRHQAGALIAVDVQKGIKVNGGANDEPLHLRKQIAIRKNIKQQQ